MTAFLIYLQSTPVPNVSVELWEIAKGVMLSLSTLGVGYLIKGIRHLEFAVRDLRRDVSGDEGGNGLKGATRDHDSRLDILEIWKTRIDTATEIERELYEGPDRRSKIRRLRDKIVSEELLLQKEEDKAR